MLLICKLSINIKVIIIGEVLTMTCGELMLKVIIEMDDSMPPVCETGSHHSADESQVTMHTHKQLTAEEQQLLRLHDTRKIPERRQSQLENEARKHWDLFYKRNSTKFFKDRHWTLSEFQELSGAGLVRSALQCSDI